MTRIPQVELIHAKGSCAHLSLKPSPGTWGGGLPVHVFLMISVGLYVGMKAFYYTNKEPQGTLVTV